MPKLSKILSLGKKKSDDAVSVASGASNVSKRSSRSLKSSKSKLSRSADAPEEEPTGLQICGYVVRKEKDLPKLHKHCWRGELEKAKEDLRKGADVNGRDKAGRCVAARKAAFRNVRCNAACAPFPVHSYAGRPCTSLQRAATAAWWACSPPEAATWR